MVIRFSDVQEAASALPDLQFEYRQLEAGAITVDVMLRRLGRLHVTQVKLDRLSEGAGLIAPDRLIFVLCLAASPDPHLFEGQALRAGQVFMARGGKASDSVLRAGFHASLVNVDVELVERMLRCDVRGLKSEVLTLAPETRADLLWLQEQSVNCPPHQSLALADAIALCLCRGARLSCANDMPRRLDSKTLLARAIRDRLEERPESSVSEVCHDLSISESTFRRVFGEVYQLSPGQYQLATRLNRVKQELKDRPPVKGAVSDAACRQGFWHMGRFSGQYRRHFGETPRETLLGQGRREGLRI